MAALDNGPSPPELQVGYDAVLAYCVVLSCCFCCLLSCSLSLPHSLARFARRCSYRKLEFGDIHKNNVEQLRKLNLVTFPVRYNEKFYTNILNTPPEFTQVPSANSVDRPSPALDHHLWHPLVLTRAYTCIPTAVVPGNPASRLQFAYWNGFVVGAICSRVETSAGTDQKKVRVSCYHMASGRQLMSWIPHVPALLVLCSPAAVPMCSCAHGWTSGVMSSALYYDSGSLGSLSPEKDRTQPAPESIGKRTGPDSSQAIISDP